MKIFETIEKKYGEKAFLTPTENIDEYICVYADKKCKKCKQGKKCKIKSNCIKESSLEKLKEGLTHKKSIDQLKNISKILGDMDISKRTPDSGFSNALSSSKRDITKHNIKSFSDYLKEPFVVNQNRVPKK